LTELYIFIIILYAQVQGGSPKHATDMDLVQFLYIWHIFSCQTSKQNQQKCHW